LSNFYCIDKEIINEFKTEISLISYDQNNTLKNDTYIPCRQSATWYMYNWKYILIEIINMILYRPKFNFKNLLFDYENQIRKMTINAIIM